MTMPHLMNCPHMPDGWCLDCVKELNDLRLAQAESRFQHTEAELRDVADKLRDLNSGAANCVAWGFAGCIDVRWAGELMGTIELDDKTDMRSWVYIPLARRIFPNDEPQSSTAVTPGEN